MKLTVQAAQKRSSGTAEKTNNHLHPITGITKYAIIAENADPTTQNNCKKKETKSNIPLTKCMSNSRNYQLYYNTVHKPLENLISDRLNIHKK